MDAVTILSGGMDSAVLLISQLHKGMTFSAISFDYGAKHDHREIPMAEALCRQNGVPHKVVALEARFAALDKRDIGDLGRLLGADFRQTWTCYKGGGNHCGTCGACDERKYALRWEAGLDPTDYER